MKSISVPEIFDNFLGGCPHRSCFYPLFDFYPRWPFTKHSL